MNSKSTIEDRIESEGESIAKRVSGKQFMSLSQANKLFESNLSYRLENGKIIFENNTTYKELIMSTVWDFGNDILYQLCRENFSHQEDEVIIAKTLFIGRIYAAAIERRKKFNDIPNDNFYVEKIVPIFKNSEIDSKLNRIKEFSLSNESLIEVLEIHKYLVDELKTISDLEKRSFVSKYLHFHLPELYFIYDSRASNAISKKGINVPKDYKYKLKDKNVDNEYALFFIKCFLLRESIKEETSLLISPRQIDNILIG